MIRIHPLVALSVVLSLSQTGVGTGRADQPAGVSIENMKETVAFLTGLRPPRNYLHRASLKRSADFIRQRFAAYGTHPQRQTFVVSGHTYENVMTRVGPDQGPRVIVGAHYDVAGDQPGADDNASGIAGLLELARLAKRHAADLPYGVDFVAYALEEPPYFDTPYMGSYIHASSLHENKTAVRGMICLESIGFYSERRRSQRYPIGLMRLFYPGTGDFIAVVGNFASASLVRQISPHLRATKVNVETLRAPSWLTGVDLSDHRNYWHFGYKAVMVTDTAFYRNPHYHMPSDTMDTLDFDRMKEVVKGISRALLQMK